MAKVLVSMDDDLLRRLDARAAELGLTRSGLISQLAATQLEGQPANRGMRRAISRAQAACAAGASAADATALVREMRDAR